MPTTGQYKSPENRPWELCGATKPFTYRGVDYVARCSRYRGHEKSSKAGAENHFDEGKRKSW